MFGFIHKHKDNVSVQLGIVAFLISAALASVEAVWSIFINSFVQSASLTGTISAGITTLYFVLYLLSGPFLERYDEKKVTIVSMLLMSLGYLGYVFAESLVTVLALSVVVIFGDVFRSQTHAVLIRDTVSTSQVSEAEGVNYAFMNAGWLLAPLLAGFIAESLGVQLVFFMACLLAIIAALHVRNLRIKPIVHGAASSHKELFSNIKQFFSDSQRLISYVVNGGVSFWWAVLYVYVPLYILEQGLSTYWVGIFLTSIAVPLVLLEYSVGKWTAVYSHRFFLVLGYSIVGVCAIIAGFSSSVYLTLGFLALASFGSAMLEGTRESFYFSITNQRDEERYLGTWMTARTLSSTLAKLFVAAILLYFSYEIAYVLVGVVLLFVACISSYAKG